MSGGALIVCEPEHDDLTRSAAAALTGEARAALRSAHQWAARAVELVEQAWAMRADIALGYPSWEAYCATEFAGLREIRIPVPTRVEMVAALTEAKMSTRKVAAVLHVNAQTVRADITRSRELHPAALPAAAPAEITAPPAVVPQQAPTQVQQVLDALTTAGPTGLTWIELGEALGLHHGSSSAVLSKLHRRGLIERTSTYRAASAAYVLRWEAHVGTV